MDDLRDEWRRGETVEDFTVDEIVERSSGCGQASNATARNEATELQLLDRGNRQGLVGLATYKVLLYQVDDCARLCANPGLGCAVACGDGP